MKIKTMVFIFLVPGLVFAQTTFIDVAGQIGIKPNTAYPFATAWADYDKDGYLDLFIGHDNRIPNKLYDGESLVDENAIDKAPFAGVNDAGVTSAIAWADYDNDSYLDLLVTSRSSAPTRLYRNDGAIDPQFDDECSAMLGNPGPIGAVTWGDFDQDGDVDLFAPRANSSGISILYINKVTESEKTFEVTSPITEMPGERFTKAQWVDYDLDGDQDLAVSAFTNNVVNSIMFIYSNEDGRFTRAHTLDVEFRDETWIETAPFGTHDTWADFDNDGDLDVYFAKNAGKPPISPVRGQSRNMFYRNDLGEFTNVAPALKVEAFDNCFGAGWGDVDNDGDMDLYLGNSQEGPKQHNNLFINPLFNDISRDENDQPKGEFVDYASSAGVNDIESGRNGTWADYDRDGDLDIYVPTVFAPDRFFKNQLNPVARSDAKWISIDLVGTIDNSAGIGARVVLHTSHGPMTRVVSGGGYGLGSQDALRLHFGLGSASVAKVEVYWPTQEDPQVITDRETIDKYVNGRDEPVWEITQSLDEPPIANAGLDQTDEDAVEATGTLTEVPLDGSGSSDPDGDDLTYRWTGPFGTATGVNPIVLLPLGTHTITLVVNDGDLDSEPDEVVIEVVDTTPPEIELKGENPLTLECPAPYVEPGAIVTDVCDPNPSLVVTGSVDPNTPGTYPITYTATDATGNERVKTRIVEVVDTIPPTVIFDVNPTEIWPPNHKMQLVASNISATDQCCIPELSITVSSNESVDATGDGETEPDWEIIDNGDGTFDVKVRAERSGNGEDRVYTIEATATDASGNSASETATVTVPHDKGKSKGKKKEVAALAPPQGYALYSNIPNPFNPETTIRFDIPVAGNIRLEVLDILGRRIRLLIEGGISAGTHQVLWDGRDDSGQSVSSGVYLYRLQAGEYHAVKRMLLVR